MSKATVRDKLWIWGHEAGSHNDRYELQQASRMTPLEGAVYLGVPNMIMVGYAGLPKPPFRQYALAFRPLQRVVWSIVAAGGRTQGGEVQAVRQLATSFPNFSGVMMDDFFRPSESGGMVGTYSVAELQAIRDQLRVSTRRLDLWVVLYEHQLAHSPAEHLAQCDFVSFWTWKSELLRDLEENFKRVEAMAPAARKVLGCYMYDYGNHRPIPLDLLQRQSELGLQWLQDGRIEGMIFLASCICDLELEAVEWTRNWIGNVADRAL